MTSASPDLSERAAAGAIRRAVITGASGFTGPHLARLLLADGAEVFGVDRAPAVERGVTNAAYRAIAGDLREPSFVEAVVRDVRPTHLFHLAALTRSDDLSELLAANVVATNVLLQTITRISPATRVLVPGSASEYGAIRDEELPVTEQQPLRPLTAYGLSKAGQTLRAQAFALGAGAQVYIARPFNLLGLGEPTSMACSSVARQIASIELGLQPPVVRVGNTESERDFLDIRDVVRAYRAIVTRGTPGTPYNVCSGRATSLRGVLDLLTGLARSSFRIEVDPSRLRRDDVPRSVGSAAKLTSDTGWRPEISLERALADLLDHWRARVSADRDLA